jgi:hypothetical protein
MTESRMDAGVDRTKNITPRSKEQLVVSLIHCLTERQNDLNENDIASDALRASGGRRLRNGVSSSYR